MNKTVYLRTTPGVDTFTTIAALKAYILSGADPQSSLESLNIEVEGGTYWNVGDLLLNDIATGARCILNIYTNVAERTTLGLAKFNIQLHYQVQNPGPARLNLTYLIYEINSVDYIRSNCSVTANYCYITVGSLANRLFRSDYGFNNLYLYNSIVAFTSGVADPLSGGVLYSSVFGGQSPQVANCLFLFRYAGVATFRVIDPAYAGADGWYANCFAFNYLGTVVVDTTKCSMVGGNTVDVDPVLVDILIQSGDTEITSSLRNYSLTVSSPMGVPAIPYGVPIPSSTSTTTTSTTSTTSTSTTFPSDTIFLRGTKAAGTYLYINDIYISDVPVEATSWVHVVEYPEVGVNGFKIYTIDSDGNKSAAIITYAISEGTNTETLTFDKQNLRDGISYSNKPTYKNVEFVAKYIASQVVQGTIQVKE